MTAIDDQSAVAHGNHCQAVTLCHRKTEEPTPRGSGRLIAVRCLHSEVALDGQAQDSDADRAGLLTTAIAACTNLGADLHDELLCRSDDDRAAVLGRRQSTTTAITTCANFRLDLHVQLLW